MLDNSGELARLINEAGEIATGKVNETLDVLHATAHEAIGKTQATTAAAVSEMIETHNMLRTDTISLFERLRDANILLQEVMSGSQENMGRLETALTTRVSEFVDRDERHLGAHRRIHQPRRGPGRSLQGHHRECGRGPRRPRQRNSTATAARWCRRSR